MSNHECAGLRSEVREAAGPAVGSVGRVVGVGQTWNFMCNLLGHRSNPSFTEVLQSPALADALASVLLGHFNHSFLVFYFRS